MSHLYPVHHLPDPQRYAVEQERQRHNGALFSWGEWSVFVLLWKVVDHQRGLVERCSVCYVAYGKTAAAYGQPANQNCPECFGTTFEGGYKAIIVRPALWDANEEDYRENKRGDVTIATATVQSTSDFRLRTGDYIFRANNTRWQMRSVSTNHLRTGFEMPTRERTPVGYNFGQVSLQDESSVAYLIPPSASELEERLDVNVGRYPDQEDFSDIEDVRGSLT